MIRAAKIDNNHKEIVNKLRQFPGISVISVAQLKNFCDICVGFKGKNYLYEIKCNKKKKLTQGELHFQFIWRGHIKTITSAEEILEEIEYFPKIKSYPFYDI